MANRELLPDEVWAQLRPADARLTRLSYRRLRLLGAAAVLVATCAALIAVSGLLAPRLNGYSGSATGESGSRTITQSVDIRNDGWFTEHVERIEVTGPGLRMTSRSGAANIGPGAVVTIQLTYQVTDCSAVQRDQTAPMLLRLRRPWGHRTATLRSDAATGLAWSVCHGPT